MTESAIIDYITSTFDGVDVLTAQGDSYFFYDPQRNIPPDRRMPFVTLVTGDRHDKSSNLDRPGVFRLNIGVEKETYRSLFGPPPKFRTDGGVADTGHDFSVLNQLMPHPVYAAMSWVCILSPSDPTFEHTVRPLLAEAHALAVGNYAKRQGS